jgi:hypothetical protein
VLTWLQVVAREDELKTCQTRLERSQTEVRGVRALLSSSLQPRIPCQPLPRLISLDCAAAAASSLHAAGDGRLPARQVRLLHSVRGMKVFKEECSPSCLMQVFVRRRRAALQESFCAVHNCSFVGRVFTRDLGGRLTHPNVVFALVVDFSYRHLML